MRPLHVLIATASCALLLAACGSEQVSVSEGEEATAAAGAEIFATHCAGCHTLSAAGTQGSGNRALRAQGPNFDQRVETYDDVIFAIQNGGFSGAIMPQNIVVGEDATLVAEFLSKYSGSDVEEPPRPSPAEGTETGEANAAPDSVEGGDTPPAEVEPPPDADDQAEGAGGQGPGGGGQGPGSGGSG